MLVGLEDAAERLGNGETLAVPTDTVYGLVARVNDADAVEQLYTIKQRRHAKPLIILGATSAQLEDFIAIRPPDFDVLVSQFWPGALTLVVPANMATVSARIRADGPTIGLRVPDHPLTRELLTLVGPVASSSANRAGDEAPTSPDTVEEQLKTPTHVLDGGPCSDGTASTVLRYTGGGWQVLREGSIPLTSINAVLTAGRGLVR